MGHKVGGTMSSKALAMSAIIQVLDNKELSITLTITAFNEPRKMI